MMMMMKMMMQEQEFYSSPMENNIEYTFTLSLFSSIDTSIDQYNLFYIDNVKVTIVI